MTKAYCIRTAMCGGGTSYDVYFLKADKPSYPLHGSTYATVISHPFGKKGYQEFFDIRDAIDRKERWSMDAGLPKWEAGKQLDKRAKRLAVRIAKRAYPELRGLRELPFLWASWNQPSAEMTVSVNMNLPE